MNFEYYKVFYIIAKNKNITKAANELNISQPAISRMLKTMEEQLNTKLFVRKTKGVMLTQVGNELYNLISNEINNIINAENDFSKLINNKSIKIAVDKSILNYLINEHKLDNILNNNKNVDFINTNHFDLLNNQLLNNLIDFAYVLEPVNYQFSDNIKFRETHELHLILVSNSKNDKISNKPLVTLNNKRFNKIYDDVIHDSNIVINEKIKVDDYDNLYPLILNGYANGFLVKELIANEMNNNLLFEIPINLKTNNFKLGILYNVNNELKIKQYFDI